jgi:hypothetical protein
MPNAIQYFIPPLEAYETYNQNLDTVPAIVKEFFKYESNKTGPHFPTVYSVAFNPWKFAFPALNVLFIALVLFYLAGRRYRYQLPLFNHTLLIFGLLYVTNFLFIVLLAPTVFRYHVFVITLLIPLILCLFQNATTAAKTKVENVPATA